MNCKQFNSISLEEVLLSLGHLPTKQNEKEAWYLNPFATESQASFKINKSLNYWYLFSEGIGGTTVDLLKKYLNKTASEILIWADIHPKLKEDGPIREKRFEAKVDLEVISGRRCVLGRYRKRCS